MSKAPRERKYILLDDTASFAVRESYRIARTNLIFALSASGGGNCRRVVITSPGVSDGKTITCINLALAFALAGSKVLLVDADMRKPRLHRIFGIEQDPGLSDLLGGLANGSCVRETRFENLSVLTSGTVPPNPTELLMSPNFADLMDSGLTGFEYVFIDTPPIGVVTDAAVAASRADGALLVSRQRHTDRRSLEDSGAALKQAGGRILGHIFNDVDPRYSDKKYRCFTDSAERYYEKPKKGRR